MPLDWHVPLPERYVESVRGQTFRMIRPYIGDDYADAYHRLLHCSNREIVELEILQDDRSDGWLTDSGFRTPREGTDTEFGIHSSQARRVLANALISYVAADNPARLAS